MKKYITISVGLMIAWGMFSSCNKKKNDWNLNPAPTVTLSGIEARAMNDVTFSTITVPGTGQLVLDTVSQVRLEFEVSSKNKIKQISFHDGTWGANMYMVKSNGDTLKATPPESVYRPESLSETETFNITFDKIDASTIYTMIVLDPHGQSTSYVFKMRPKDS